MRTERSDLAESEQFEMSAMAALRSSAIEYDPGPGYDKMVVRSMLLAQAKSRFSYWSPAAIGAAVAATSVLAILQMLSHSSAMPTIDIAGKEAHRVQRATTVFPELDLGGAKFAR